METCYYYFSIYYDYFVYQNMHIYNSHNIHFLLLWTLFFVQKKSRVLDNRNQTDNQI